MPLPLQHLLLASLPTSSTLTTSAGMTPSSAENFVCILLLLRPSFSNSLLTSSGKEKKRIDKTAAEEKSSVSSETTAPSGSVTPEMLRAALEQVKQEEPPSSTEDKEAYFMTQVGMGEQLAAQGAFSFRQSLLNFHAQKVNPNCSREQARLSTSLLPFHSTRPSAFTPLQ